MFLNTPDGKVRELYLIVWDRDFFGGYECLSRHKRPGKWGSFCTRTKREVTNLFRSNKKRTLTNKEAFFALNIYVRTMNYMNEDILR